MLKVKRFESKTFINLIENSSYSLLLDVIKANHSRKIIMNKYYNRANFLKISCEKILKLFIMKDTIN